MSANDAMAWFNQMQGYAQQMWIASASQHSQPAPRGAPVAAGKGGKASIDPQTFKGRKVFAGGLHGSTTSGHLQSHFGKYGKVREAVVATDKNGQSKYFGFITFSTNAEAKNCCMQKHHMQGRWIDVKPYDDGSDDSKGSSKGIERGRSRSRSGRSSPSVMRQRGKGQRSGSSSSSSSFRSMINRRGVPMKKSRSSSLQRKKTTKKSRSRGKSSSRSRSRSRRNKNKSRSGSKSKSSSASRSRSKSSSSARSRAAMRTTHGAKVATLDDLPVTVEVSGGGAAPEAISEWRGMVASKILPAEVKTSLEKEGMARPTLVQRYCVPMVFNRQRDLICSAQTGSGKTFAFVIPLVAHLIRQGEVFRPWFPGAMTQGCPLVCVLSPTRELAIQTDREIQCLIKGSKLFSLVVYGGEPIHVQLERMDRQVDIVSGTPGRLTDMIDQAKMSLNYVQTLVVDEADQMFDMGLERIVVDLILARDLPRDRQTLLFSATFPPKVEMLCNSILRQLDTKDQANTGPWTIKIGKYDEGKVGGSVENIKQYVLWANSDSEKDQLLMHDVTQYIQPKDKCIIFTNRRKFAETLKLRLQAAVGVHLRVDHLHGKLEQWAREEVVRKFEKEECEIMIASNVASRGLDFPNVKLVIQYDMAEDTVVYTHRIGRTGRCGSGGVATAYFTRKDRSLAEPLVSFLKLNKQEVPPWLEEMARPKPPPRRYGGRSDRYEDRGRYDHSDRGHYDHSDRGHYERRR